MKRSSSTIVLLACITLATAVLAFGKHSKSTPVVARFGGECAGAHFHPSPRLRQLIRRTEAHVAAPLTFRDGAFAYDLNGDRKDEFFVRLKCGATGNCTWGVFSDHPARLRGVFAAWFFYIHRRTNLWSQLTTYTREGGDQGVIATLASRRGKYIETYERTERGYYGNPQPFLKRMGLPKCD